jgi:hypothetical protein
LDTVQDDIRDVYVVCGIDGKPPASHEPAFFGAAASPAQEIIAIGIELLDPVIE